MKKFESLGDKLSKAEQKSIKGGAVDGNGVACVYGDGTEVGIIDPSSQPSLTLGFVHSLWTRRQYSKVNIGLQYYNKRN